MCFDWKLWWFCQPVMQWIDIIVLLKLIILTLICLGWIYNKILHTIMESPWTVYNSTFFKANVIMTQNSYVYENVFLSLTKTIWLLTQNTFLLFLWPLSLDVLIYHSFKTQWCYCLTSKETHNNIHKPNNNWK